MFLLSFVLTTMWCYVGSSYSSDVLKSSTQSLGDTASDIELLSVSNNVHVAYNKRYCSMIKYEGGFLLYRGIYCDDVSALFSGSIKDLLLSISGEYTIIMYDSRRNILYVSDTANSMYVGGCCVTYDSSGERIRKEYILSTSVASIKTLCDQSSTVSKMLRDYYFELDVSDAMNPHTRQYTGCEKFEINPKLLCF
jgi:hypothetical protein